MFMFLTCALLNLFLMKFLYDFDVHIFFSSRTHHHTLKDEFLVNAKIGFKTKWCRHEIPFHQNSSELVSPENLISVRIIFKPVLLCRSCHAAAMLRTV